MRSPRRRRKVRCRPRSNVLDSSGSGLNDSWVVTGSSDPKCGWPCAGFGSSADSETQNSPAANCAAFDARSMATSPTQYAHPEALVDADWVEQHLNYAGLRVIRINE